jgi:hypothetical protein
MPRGGSRSGSGRPRLGPTPRVVVAISADPRTLAALDRYAARFRLSRSSAADTLLRGALGLDVGLGVPAKPKIGS